MLGGTSKSATLSTPSASTSATTAAPTNSSLSSRSSSMLEAHTQPGEPAPSADEAWRDLLITLVVHGSKVAPRNQPTLEVLHHISLTTDLNHPVITYPTRKLNYHFMAAEALWIVSGRNDVAFLAEHNKRMLEFRDDG